MSNSFLNAATVTVRIYTVFVNLNSRTSYVPGSFPPWRTEDNFLIIIFVSGQVPYESIKNKPTSEDSDWLQLHLLLHFLSSDTTARKYMGFLKGRKQTFTGILKPGAAGGLGKRTPVCCVGKHFKLFRFAWLDHRGDTRSTESETRKAGKMGGGPGRQQRVHLGIWRHCGETVSGSTDMRRVFSAYMVFPKESFSFLKSDFKLYFVLGYSWLTMLW